MFTYILYGAAALGLLFSFIKDRQKTTLALKKAWAVVRGHSALCADRSAAHWAHSFRAERAGHFPLAGRRVWYLGHGPGRCSWLYYAHSRICGFSAAASLVAAGAGYAQAAIFLSTLMMVGVATLPLESKYFGKRAALKRNLGLLPSPFLVRAPLG